MTRSRKAPEPKGIPSLRSFLASLESAEHQEFAARPSSRVANEDAFSEMKSHILGLYEDVEAAHSFVDETGATFDCIPIEQQPALRGLSEAVPLWPGQRAPFVVIGGESTNPHHRVHRRRSAEYFASRPIDSPAVEHLLRLGQVIPVHLAAKQFGDEGRGYVDELVLVPRAGLQHGGPDSRIGTEPVGNHGARGARPDHDIVGLHQTQVYEPPPVIRVQFAGCSESVGR